MKTILAMLLGMAAMIAPASKQFTDGTIPADPIAFKAEFSEPSAAVEPPEESRSIFDRATEIGTPCNGLPDHVISEPGKFTVFADFDHPAAEGIPLYIINRTTKPIRLQCQDGDVYLKLQFREQEYNWQRAESHVFSWCGNSYHASNLKPGGFRVVHGYRAKKGRWANVRYRFYKQHLEVASNEGLALVDDEEIRKASSDGMSPPDWPPDQVERVALGKQTIVNGVDLCNLRDGAIAALASDRFSDDQRTQILRELQAQKESGHYARRLEELIENIEEQRPRK